MQLRTQLQELEKRVSDLTATNEFLLDQVYWPLISQYYHVTIILSSD